MPECPRLACCHRMMGSEGEADHAKRRAQKHGRAAGSIHSFDLRPIPVPADRARAEPVVVAKHGRPVVVVMAVEEFERSIGNFVYGP